MSAFAFFGTIFFVVDFNYDLQSYSNVSLARVWQIKDRALHKLKVNGYDDDLQNYIEITREAS